MQQTPISSEKKKKLLNGNQILSATALFISVCTVLILLYQAYLSNKLYYLEDKALKTSAMPVLEIQTSFGTGGNTYFVLDVENVGVGPARIKEVYVRYRDTVLAADFPAALYGFIEKGVEANKTSNYSFSNISPNRMIPAGRTIKHVAANDSATAMRFYNLFINEKAVNMAIKYTSIYGDQDWTAFSSEAFPLPSDKSSNKK